MRDSEGPAIEASLLDVDPSLAHVIGARLAITKGRLPLLEVIAPAQGDWTPAGSRFAVLHGLLLCGDPGSEAAGAFGPGDLIGAGALAAGPWTAGPRVSLAVIDDAFAALVRPWPQVEARMTARAGRQAASRAALRSAAAVTNPEERLLAVLWTLVARWGEQAHEGFTLRVGLDSDALARLTGLAPALLEQALESLATDRMLSATDDGWLLSNRPRHADALRRRRDELRHRLAEQLAVARATQQNALAIFERVELNLAAASR
jgi:hypothetical protein